MPGLLPRSSSFDTPASELAKLSANGIILSGGPASVYSKKNAPPDRYWRFQAWPPHSRHLLRCPIDDTTDSAEKVEHSEKRENGAQDSLHLQRKSCPLFPACPKWLDVWNSPRQRIPKLPKGFREQSAKPVIFRTMRPSRMRSRHFYGLQFHPGGGAYANGQGESAGLLIYNICGCKMELDHAFVHRPDVRRECASR